MKGLAAVLLLALAVTAVAAEQGPYEDIQGLLASASASANGLRALDSRGAPRVVTVVHNHAHVVPHDMPRRVAQRIAEASTPAPKPVRIVAMPNRAQAARHAAEDAQYARDVAQPAVHKLNVKTTLHGMVPPYPHPAGKTPSGPSRYTIRGVKSPAGPPAVKVNGKGYHFPLVDRRLQKPTFSVVADLDGSDAAGGAGAFKAHTAADLQAEAAKLLARAQALKEKRSEREAKAAAKKAENAKLGIFTEKKDAGYEDEITRLKRASARINRLQEQIETPHNEDSFEASIARKKYFLKIYEQLKAEISQLVEDYALRTGNSIFTMFGNGKIDPSIAAFLPPNSVAGILSKYTNPTQDRDDESPRDVISGREAKRIQYSIDYYKAKQARARLPMPPKLAPTDEELAKQEQFNNPALNKILATQSGEFGQGRPAITTGAQAIGRSSVHITTVNPADTQKARGMPFQVNLKTKRVKKH